jgi:hypothetical protein
MVVVVDQRQRFSESGIVLVYYDPDNRGILVLIGGSLAGLASVYVYFHPVSAVIPDPPKATSPAPTPAQPEVPVLRVCRGEIEAKCPAHDRFIGCGDFDAWVAQACKRSYSFISTDSDVRGNQCGYALMRIRCAE